MNERTRRYERYDDEALQLDEVLEPYDRQEPPPIEDEPPYEGEGFYDAPYEDYADDGRPYEEEYSDAHEALDEAGRFKVAMGVFDTVSIIIGVVVILGLVGLLLSLAGWLRTDILHSALLLQSGLQ